MKYDHLYIFKFSWCGTVTEFSLSLVVLLWFSSLNNMYTLLSLLCVSCTVHVHALSMPNSSSSRCCIDIYFCCIIASDRFPYPCSLLWGLVRGNYFNGEEPLLTSLSEKLYQYHWVLDLQMSEFNLTIMNSLSVPFSKLWMGYVVLKNRSRFLPCHKVNNWNHFTR